TVRDVAGVAPMFVAGAIMSYVTMGVEKSSYGSDGDEYDLSWLDRFLVAGRALWFYAAKLAWPFPVIFSYPRWTIDAHAWWQYLYPAAALAVMAGLWFARGRIGRGPLAAVLIFAGMLVPVLGFFHIFSFRYSYVADHFQYHA